MGCGKPQMHIWSASYYVLQKAITLNPVIVKAGHEQVRNRKCVLLLCKIMITKRMGNKFCFTKRFMFLFSKRDIFLQYFHIG